MKNISIKIVSIAFLLLISCVKTNAQIMVYHQGFNSLNTLLANGWERKNNSYPLGPGTSGGAGTWTQGDTTILSAYSGPGNSYALDNYSCTDSAGCISDWLLTDTLTLRNGDTVSLYTLSYNSDTYPDNLECRFSTNGTSDTVGNDTSSVGNFYNLLFAINPNFDTTSYPSVSGRDSIYNHHWTRFYGIVSGLSGYTLCRVGLRYYVPQGGPFGVRSSTIGVDSFTVTRGQTTGIIENTFAVGMQLYPNPAKENVYLNLFNRGDYVINIYNNIGQNVLSFKTESSKPIDISMFAPSLYTVQVIDIRTGNNKSIRFIKE